MVFNLKDSFFNVNNPCSYVKLKLSEVIFIIQNQVTSDILNFIPANVSLVKSETTFQCLTSFKWRQELDLFLPLSMEK